MLYGMKVALAGVKGGAGKSTSAVALAHLAQGDYPGQVVLVDLDPQATSRRWLPAITRTAEDAGGIAIAMTEARVGILDLPPGRSDAATAGLTAADLVVAVCGLGPGELDGLAATCRLVDPDLILPTRIDRRRALHHEAMDLLSHRFGSRVLTPVPASAVVERAQASHRPLPALSAPGLAYQDAWHRVRRLLEKAS